MLYLTPPEQIDDWVRDEPSYRADQLRSWLYKSPTLGVDQMTNLPKSLRSSLENELWPFAVEQYRVDDSDLTRKWLFRTPDGATIESVLMAYPQRLTLCISSQAGCAMACSFCATGQFGFERHLTAGEIFAQVAYANAYVREQPIRGAPERVTNVVFMGMGEPLANWGHTSEALRRMIDIAGLSARAVTVSTVGVVPGIWKLTAAPWNVYLAISLHAADDELRSRLVPLNKRYPIASLISAARRYFEVKGRRISIEWTMIDGVNDSADQALKLATIARDLRAHVNLIELNPTPLSNAEPSGAASIRRFLTLLQEEGISATRRDTRGQNIEAACGQLKIAATPR